MKFSIKFSILSLVLSLLISITLAIVTIYHYTISNILITSTKNTLEQASEHISEEILKYLLPLHHISYVGAYAIQNNTVIPKNSPEFVNFLYSLVTVTEDICTIFFVNTNGDAIGIQRSDDKNHFSINSTLYSINGTKVMQDLYSDSNLNVSLGKPVYIRSEPITHTTDLRLKPWYQQTTTNQETYTWLTYPTPIASTVHTNAPFVVATLHPVYSSTGKVRGVFGVSMPLNKLHNFVNQIKPTDNSFVFVCNEKQQVLSAYSAKNDLDKDYRIPFLFELNVPWVETSYNLYLKNKQPLFFFNFQGKKYIAVYRDIQHKIVKDDPLWQVGIVTPVDDVIAPLKVDILYTLLALIIAVSIGIVLAIILSSGLSAPIIYLAEDARLFCKFRFNEIKNTVSHITEISLIMDAFAKMKTALSSFKRYMPSALVKNLILSGKIAEVGGENKKVTLLFSDIENFTPLSEKMLPSDLMHYLSEYFEVVTKTILSNGGTVDKYIGDGVLAFWGAPIDDSEHALHCCKTALELQTVFKTLNSSWRLKGKPELMTRIGINTGEVIVGNVGSEDRLNYTVVGDPVNLASRLEPLNKTYGTYTLVSEFTYNIVKDSFKFRLLDKVRVKGKIKGIYIYELLGNADMPSEYTNLFNNAFAKYENANWQEALETFRQLATKYPNDKLPKVFINRCIQFTDTPPTSWDGYWVMEEK
ncbi:adenylate cyclase [Gammaproteobacteria bacterium]